MAAETALVLQTESVRHEKTQDTFNRVAVSVNVSVDKVVFTFEPEGPVRCEIQGVTFLGNSLNASYVEGTPYSVRRGFLGSFGVKIGTSPKMKKHLNHFLTKALRHKYASGERPD